MNEIKTMVITSIITVFISSIVNYFITSNQIESQQNIESYKTENKLNEYRYTELQNNLKLLISSLPYFSNVEKIDINLVNDIFLKSTTQAANSYLITYPLLDKKYSDSLKKLYNNVLDTAPFFHEYIENKNPSKEETLIFFGMLKIIIKFHQQLLESIQNQIYELIQHENTK